MINLDPIIEKVHGVVKSHYLGDGAYARWIWQNAEGSRELGINEYGCADAMNILYTISRFPTGAERAEASQALRSLQKPESGLFEEATHHFIHTTAHCVAALELFDAQPAYPPKAMQPYFDKEGLKKLLDSLDWQGSPWAHSHRGAGVYVVATLTDSVDLDWQNFYFEQLAEATDPAFGMSRVGTVDPEKGAPVCEHLYGWFHYMFNMEYAKRPLKYPSALIDTCIELYDSDLLGETFGRGIGFREVDWVYALARALRQAPHRVSEARERLRSFASSFIAYLSSLDFEHDDGVNDLHMLFGTLCCLAELQSALPGEIVSTKPLRLVLNRRPFI